MGLQQLMDKFQILCLKFKKREGRLLYKDCNPKLQDFTPLGTGHYESPGKGGGEGLKDFGNVTIKLNLPNSPLNGS